jgi:hypothetical protein
VSGGLVPLELEGGVERPFAVLLLAPDRTERKQFAND